MSARSATHTHLQTLLRFLGGMADFARVNSHNPRWNAIPGLRESGVLKRCCLFCWVRKGVKTYDSEWHTCFSCPISKNPRNRFRLALRSFPINKFNSIRRKLATSQLERKTVSTDLATLVIKCRKDERLVCELARFVVDSIACRQRAFRKLSVRDIFPTRVY